MAEIISRRGRERSLLHHHPWIFSGSIESVKGTPRPGETVDVLSKDGLFLAKAAYNPHSQISGRVWTWNEAEEISPDFFARKFKQAMDIRDSQRNLINSNARRLVHGESDGLPGLIVDQYNDIVVVQFLTAGVEFWRATLIEIIQSLTQCRVLFERSDVDVRKLEGLEDRKGLLYGERLENPVNIDENGVIYQVDIVEGHKTGFYLDQRDNRLLTRSISGSRKILDCFAYTGGFALNAMLCSVKSIILVDSSKEALRIGQSNFGINQITSEDVKFVEEDVFKYLRFLRDKSETFDLIILDPPKFAPTSAQAERASRGYKDINLLALKLLKKDGLLLTFSCSGGISEELFQKIIAGATADANAEVILLKRLHQAIDHPVALNFPEGAYLKGFLLQKVN